MSNHSKKQKIIQSLNPDDAFTVLMLLLKENPDLEDRIYQISMRILTNVDSDDIMLDVYSELNMLDVDDLYNSSGRTRYGYVEPSEEAWNMFQDALEPFIDEMKKYQKRNMPIVAKEFCIGIIKGLRKFENESTSDFKDWAVDAPEESVENVFDEWKTGQPSKEHIDEISQIIKEGR